MMASPLPPELQEIIYGLAVVSVAAPLGLDLGCPLIAGRIDGALSDTLSTNKVQTPAIPNVR